MSKRLIVWTGRRGFQLSASMRPHIDGNKIGNREVVGHGMSGQASYIDTPLYPFPAIRFKEIVPVYKALREKEKGDWKSLTLQEKKCLYRVSFCQTFSEMTAPTGEWKSIVGLALLIMNVGLWLYLLQVKVCQQALPRSFELKRQQAQLRRILALRMNPITGISSEWDYENETWK